MAGNGGPDAGGGHWEETCAAGQGREGEPQVRTETDTCGPHMKGGPDGYLGGIHGCELSG